MSYSFNGSNQYLIVAAAVITAPPYTFAGFFNSTSDSTNQAIVSVANKTTVANGRTLITAGGTEAGDPTTAFAGGIGSGNAASSSGYSINVWGHAAGVFSSTTSRTAYRNGGSSGTNTNSVTMSGLDNTNIGARETDFAPPADLYLSGQIAEAAIWNVALTDAEIASLGKGFKPTRIRPQSLVFYAPLVRNLVDLSKNRRTITNNNTATVAAHPRVY